MWRRCQLAARRSWGSVASTCRVRCAVLCGAVLYSAVLVLPVVCRARVQPAVDALGTSYWCAVCSLHAKQSQLLSSARLVGPCSQAARRRGWRWHVPLTRRQMCRWGRRASGGILVAAWVSACALRQYRATVLPHNELPAHRSFSLPPLILSSCWMTLCRQWTLASAASCSTAASATAA